jgi:hypothetical protein
LESGEVDEVLSDAKHRIGLSANSLTETVCHGLKEKLIAFFDSLTADLREEIQRCNDPVTFPLETIVFHDRHLAALSETHGQLPRLVVSRLVTLPEKTKRVIDKNLDWMRSGADRMMSAIVDRRVVESFSKTLSESVEQIEEMVAEFCNYVGVYRTAVLSMKNRELSDRVGLSPVIDDVERTQTVNKDEWSQKTIQKIFPDKEGKLQKAEEHFSDLHEKIAKMRTAVVAQSILRMSVDAENIVAEHDMIANPLEDQRFSDIVQKVVEAFNEKCSDLFSNLRDERKSLVEERRKRLERKVEAITKRRKRRLWWFTSIASLVALLVYLAYYLWQKPFNQNWTTVILVGVAANCITLFFGRCIGALTDKTKGEIEEETNDHVQDLKALIGRLIKQEIQIENWSFLERVKPKLSQTITTCWQTEINGIAQQLVVQPFEASFSELRKLAVEYIECIEEYLRITSDLAADLKPYYESIDENLDVLASVSTQIREEAILPSFKIFEGRKEELHQQLSLISKVEFS